MSTLETEVDTHTHCCDIEMTKFVVVVVVQSLERVRTHSANDDFLKLKKN